MTQHRTLADWAGIVLGAIIVAYVFAEWLA